MNSTIEIMNLREAKGMTMRKLCAYMLGTGWTVVPHPHHVMLRHTQATNDFVLTDREDDGAPAELEDREIGYMLNSLAHIVDLHIQELLDAVNAFIQSLCIKKSDFFTYGCYNCGAHQVFNHYHAPGMAGGVCSGCATPIKICDDSLVESPIKMGDPPTAPLVHRHPMALVCPSTPAWRCYPKAGNA